MKVVAMAVALVLAGAAMHVEAQGQAQRIPTRPGVTTGLFWLPAKEAKGSVLFFPGGTGGLGITTTYGRPSAENYISGSYDYLAANGYNVAMFGLPSDAPKLDIEADGRASANHLADIRAMAEWVRRQSPAPLWLMGFSAGAISAVFAAINLPDAGFAGLVLTSGVYAPRAPGGPTFAHTASTQAVDQIRIPVLVYHHAKEACPYSDPSAARSFMSMLSNAPVRKLIMAEGGANPSGNACYNKHWHGFPGMERAAVDEMSAWMARPQP